MAFPRDLIQQMVSQVPLHVCATVTVPTLPSLRDYTTLPTLLCPGEHRFGLGLINPCLRPVEWIHAKTSRIPGWTNRYLGWQGIPGPEQITVYKPFHIFISLFYSPIHLKVTFLPFRIFCNRSWAICKVSQFHLLSVYSTFDFFKKNRIN